MQVDPTLMNVGDGGTVSREIGAPKKASASMVGNPPQTLPPELRGDVPLSQQNKNTTATDCKAVKACLDPSSYNHSPEVPSPQQLHNAPMSGPPLASSDKRMDKRAEAPKLKADSAGVFPAPQWASGTKIGMEESANAGHSNVTSSKKSHTQAPSVISLPPGFQCSSLFKPGQPVAFLPSTNFSSPLCKITLPPGLGQIAALREATASQFQKEIQPQSSGGGGTPLLRTYPYPFSMGRTPAPEKKVGTSASKLKCNLTSNKNSKAVGERKSLASVVASPAIALPIQHPALGSVPPPRFTLSPTAAICCGPALASITTHSRLLNHVEKGLGVDKTSVGCLKPKPPSAAEDHVVACPIEPRDVPLDLSAKSKRPKYVKDPQNAVVATELHNNDSNQRDALNTKRTHTTAYSSTVQYPILPNTHRNGSHQKPSSRPLNHQVLEPKSSWGKGSSQDSIKNIPGTYVGVASPILASTLRSKDGKGTFADEFQNFAKQELISIIDQGEHLASRGKKPSYLLKGNQHAHGVKHVNSTSTAITQTCPSKGALSPALSGSAKAQTLQKSGTGKTAVQFCTTVVNSAWQSALLPHQGASVQRKVMQGSPKAKGAIIPEGSKFQNAHQSLSKMEDEKWDRIKSPLSNLESIVKQKALETTALTGEGFAHPTPVASRKADAVSPLTAGQDTQPKQTCAFEYPPFRSVEKKDGRQLSVPSQGDSAQTMTRHEKASVSEARDENTERHTSQGEHVGLKEIQVSSKSAAQPHVYGSNASTNGNRMESKLAQVLEGEMLKKESGASDSSPPSEKLEGIVLSILTGQSEGEGNIEKKTNGTKEDSPTKAKTAVVKQKKSTPKKLAKASLPPEPSKKAAATAKKKQDKESTPAKQVSRPKKKKQCAPVLEQSLSLDKLPQQNKEEIPKGESSLHKVEQATHNKTVTDSGSSPQNPERSVSLSSSGRPSKERKAAEGSPTPRLRRGRRRADEAHLDRWGFATPSPPPPPPPSPPPPPTQPARRPRGRPRTNPLPEQADLGKAKTSPGADGDTPAHKKRRRCRNRKYQNGEYIMERDKVEDVERREGSDSPGHNARTAADSRTDLCPSPSGASPEPAPRRPLFTRSGSIRHQESEASPECTDKPSGKRKFKSKHLSDNDEQKPKTKRSSLGKRCAPFAADNDSPDAKKPASLSASPKGSPSPPSNKKGSLGKGGAVESPPRRPIPPEVRRLIVNKNAGETLLQRAARLGYQDVVLYCLEKDIREVNRRDNAGYTALHEACSRGWTQIVQMLLNHGADVNCSAQDGTRPLHDAVASDNLPVVWLLLNHGADPTLATYSGQTPVKLAQSQSMKTFLKEYLEDLEGRSEQDSSLPWDFYSSSLFETDQEPCWDFLLSEQKEEAAEEGEARRKSERDSNADCLLFEFSSEPLLPCFHVQVSLTQGFCNWFLLTDVLKRLKMSARIFRARYPHLELVSVARAELWRQVSVSQVSSPSAPPHRGSREDDEDDEVAEEEEDEEGLVELVRCIPELQRLLGSSIDILHEEEEDDDDDNDKEERTKPGKPHSR